MLGGDVGWRRWMATLDGNAGWRRWMATLDVLLDGFTEKLLIDLGLSFEGLAATIKTQPLPVALPCTAPIH